MRKSTGTLLVFLLVALTLSYYFGSARDLVQYLEDEVRNF
jgi:hypothetical protein